MTTHQPNVQHLLRRRSDDRVLGGVASGLGDYFNVDPLLIRIGFVGLMVFGGSGLFLYLVAWALIPDDATHQSAAERFLGRSGGGVRVLLWLLLFLVIVGALANVVGGANGGAVIAAILVVGFGAVLLSRNGSGEVAQATPATTGGAAEEAGAGAAAAAPAPVVVRRPSRPPSPLGWYVLGATLIGLGALALVDNLAGVEIAFAQYFGLAIGLIGIGLVIGAWFGHARWLILLGILVLPFAWAASLVDVPLEGGWGSQRYSPATAGELQSEYRLVGGRIWLDLTRLEGTEPIELAASVGAGQLVLILPEDATVDLDASVGGGELLVLGESQNGTQLSDRLVMDGDGPELTINLETGLGDLRVETRPSREGQ